MWNVLFLYQGLLYVGLLFIIFKSKKRIDSEENRFFNIMTIENIITFIIEILLQLSIRYFGGQDTLSFILGRLYLVGLYLWFCLFSFYTYYITRSKYYTDEVVRKKKYKLATNVFHSFVIIGTLLFLTLPMSMMHEGETIYSYGPAVGLLKITIGIGAIIWIGLLLTNKDSIKNKQFIPIYAIFVLLFINVLLQTINPSVLIATGTLGFVLYIMFFTIENPDLKMIQELELAKEHADKANNAKTDFLSSMSHEIRTPLNAIVGFSDCIMDANNLEEAKANAKDINIAGQTLLEIVNGILDISKIETGKIDIINTKYKAKEVFGELATLITPRMNDKHLDFTYYIAPDIPEVLYGDYSNIKKIVTNLLSNACKYTDKGYVRYEVNCVRIKDYLRLIISVEDSGRGIKKESIEKMFTKFQRLDEDKNTTIEGTGLGLAITKQLVELMGGKIIVHSIYGEGSKFTVVLNQRISKHGITANNTNNGTLDLSNDIILLVDDAPMNLKVATKILEKYNANMIDTCESGFECIEKIENGKQYDLILLDDMMPKMSGVVTLNKLKQNPNFNIPTIALTANALSGMKEAYMKEGFDGFLAKPIVKDELVYVLNTVLKHEKFIEEPTEERSTIDNTIIPVEDNIEKELGHQVELSTEEEINKKQSTEIVEKENDIPDLVPVVDLETNNKYDENYLKENGVNLESSLELLGDMEMYNSTIHDFYDELEEKWNRIVQSKNANDMENYAIDVHSLKSDCKYLGFTALADISYQHELKSKEKDLDFVNNNFSKLEEEYNKVLNITKNYISCN